MQAATALFASAAVLLVLAGVVKVSRPTTAADLMQTLGAPSRGSLVGHPPGGRARRDRDCFGCDRARLRAAGRCGRHRCVVRHLRTHRAARNGSRCHVLWVLRADRVAADLVPRLRQRGSGCCGLHCGDCFVATRGDGRPTCRWNRVRLVGGSVGRTRARSFHSTSRGECRSAVEGSHLVIDAPATRASRTLRNRSILASQRA